MTIYQSALTLPAIPGTSITDMVVTGAKGQPDKVAIVEGASGRTVTYGQLEDQIRRFAGGLSSRGVGPGTVWALMAPNCPEFAVVFHGLSFAGATVTTLNPSYGSSEIAHQLKDSGAEAIVTVAAFLDVAKAAADEVGIDEIFLIGPGDAPSISTLMGAPQPKQVPVNPAEDVAVLPYSSGTTGFPKGVMLTHRNLVANLVQCDLHFGLEQDEVIYAVLPFFHIYGMTVLMNYAVMKRCKLITVPRFDLEQMLQLVQEHHITRLYLVPPIVLALTQHPLVDKYDLSSVKQVFSGAAPLGGELAEACAQRIGCGVAQGYGMTELSPVSHAIQDDDYKTGSVGTLLAGTEARIIDVQTGAAADRGELLIRGPQAMKGYLNNPEATAATLDDDGWLYTGDVAIRNDDGHFAIVDRLKELVKVKGFQVAPAELEALIITHPGVADVAVIGVPDDESGELPKAFVVRAPGDALQAQALQDFVKERVATYKQVRFVEFVDSIPKSASGKILRRELRNRPPA